MAIRWDGKLLNSTLDVVIDSAILVFTGLAYVPQLRELSKGYGVVGLSALFVLFNVLFSNTQLSDNLLNAAYAWPDNDHPVIPQINDGTLRGMRALGGIFGLLQITTQWICSMAVLIQFTWTAKTTASRLAMLIGVAHSAATVVPSASFALPTPSDQHMQFGLGLVILSNHYVAPIFGISQFVAQLLECYQQRGDPDVLSLRSVALQALAIALISVRLLQSLGRFTWNLPSRTPELRFIYDWSFPAANYMIYSLGCVVLLLAYLLAGRRSKAVSPEEQPLLS